MTSQTPLQDLEEADRAFARVQAELERLPATELSTLNVDLVSAASTALGVASRIAVFRDRIAKLPEFDVRNVDNLADYAKAAWYAHVTNLPVHDAKATSALMKEATEVRAKLLMWVTPLVGAGLFEEAAVARIRDGAGGKDSASDLVALVGLYRSGWDDVKSMCGVTESELSRAARIGAALFAALSQRELRDKGSQSEAWLRVRRAWTLLDRAYTQCRRALWYLRSAEGDVDTIVPNLRRNLGNSPKPTQIGARGAPMASAVTDAGASSSSSQRSPVSEPGDAFVTNAKF